MWLGFEMQAAAISKVFGKLTWATLAEGRDGDALFLFHDELILLSSRLGFEALPGEASLQEVDKYVANRLKVISPRLFDTQVVIDGCVTRCTSQRPSLALRNVLKGTGMTVSF